VILAVTTTNVASADPPRPGDPITPRDNKPHEEISVVSGPNGVTIYIGLVELAPGSEGSPGGENPISTDAGPNCTATPVNVGNASVGWVLEGLEAHPGTFPWGVNCDNGYFGIAWVPTDAPAAPDIVVGAPPIPAVDPVAVQASVLGIVPLPPIKVGANPNVGLVAMPAWFWVDGYDGSTLRGSRTLGLITIEVEITPTGYRWTFGDGATLETLSLGRPYPTESDLQHTYEQSSLMTGGTFEVQLEITFSARYRVNSGAWLPLAPVAQSYTRAYPVQQLQSVLTSSR
jgi:hypothetical protein